MDQLPPISMLKRLPIVALVKWTQTALVACVQKNCLEHVFLNLIEDMELEDVEKLPHQLSRVEGLAGMIIKKRIKWADWPTGPVTEMPISAQSTETLKRNLANIEQELAIRGQSDGG